MNFRSHQVVSKTDVYPAPIRGWPNMFNETGHARLPWVNSMHLIQERNNPFHGKLRLCCQAIDD